MLPQQIEANANAVNRNPQQQQGGPPSGPASFRPDFETVRHLRMRVELKEELRRRKCKIMWLPEGMGREKQNRTSWKVRQKKVSFSMQIKFADGESSQPQMHHDLPSNLPVQIKVLNELERESWKCAPEEWRKEHMQGGEGGGATRGGKRARKRQKQQQRLQQQQHDDQDEGENEAAATAEDSTATATATTTTAHAAPPQHKQFYISDFVLAKHGLLDVDADTASSSASKTPRAFAHLPPSITLAVQIHNMRLRNESSLKYLEWWQRKGKRVEEEGEAGDGGDEEAAEADAAERALEDVMAARPMRTWGQTAEQQDPSQQPLETQPPSSNPFISASLLSSLSAKLDAVKAATAERTAAAAKSASRQQAQLLNDYADDDDDAEVRISDDTKSKPVEDAAPPSAAARRHVYLVARSKPHDTGGGDAAAAAVAPISFISIEALLRSLPSSWAVVEYPTIEVWRSDRFRLAQKREEVVVVEHPAGADGGHAGEQDRSDTVAKASLSSLNDGSPATAEPSHASSGPATSVANAPITAKTTKTPVVAAPTKVGLGLCAYDSDSEDGDNFDNVQEQYQPEAVASLPTMTSPAANKRAKTIAPEELVGLNTASSTSSEDEGGGKSGTEGPTGLADLARQLGFAPQIAAQTPAQGTVEDSASRVTVDAPREETEVDWDV